MSVSLEWDGLAENVAALRRLPEALTAEATGLVRATAALAGAEIRAGYPVRTTNLGNKSLRAPGGLRAGVSVGNVSSRRKGVRYLVQSKAPHAQLYERGSQARHYVTVNGKKHVLGRMPPHPVFKPAIRRAERRVDAQMAGLLARHGLLVRNDAA